MNALMTIMDAVEYLLGRPGVHIGLACPLLTPDQKEQVKRLLRDPYWQRAFKERK